MIPEKKDGGYKRFYVESEKSRQIDEYKLSKGLVQIYTGDGKADLLQFGGIFWE